MAEILFYHRNPKIEVDGCHVFGSFWEEIDEKRRNYYRDCASQILQAFEEWLPTVKLPENPYLIGGAVFYPGKYYGYKEGQQDTIKAILGAIKEETK